MTSSSTQFTVSAPGSLMLMGEHAVLHGRPALCMAVHPRMKAVVHPRQDREIHITSDLGELHTNLDALPESHNLNFVLECIRSTPPEKGWDLAITSDLSSQQGLGTSAAVTVVTLAALQRLSGHPFDPAELLIHSRDIIRSVQGRGSGCDAAASVYGGIVRVEPDPFRVEPIHTTTDFLLAYVGYKTPTAEVISKVESLRQQHPALYEELFSAMETCVTACVEALRQGDWEQVGFLMNRHHGLQAALGTSDLLLEQLVHSFNQTPGILGAKISGSGLGDSVLALGTPDGLPEDLNASRVRISEQGVQIHDECRHSR